MAAELLLFSIRFYLEIKNIETIPNVRGNGVEGKGKSHKNLQKKISIKMSVTSNIGVLVGCSAAAAAAAASSAVWVYRKI